MTSQSRFFKNNTFGKLLFWYNRKALISYITLFNRENMKLLLSEDPSNVGRQKEFDYVKLFAIAFMVLIHMWEDCTNINLNVLPKGFLNNLLQFLAGPLAAPMFMTAMGIGIPYSRHCTPKDFLKRGIHIFILAYVLNFFRDALPYTIFASIHHDFSIYEFLYELLNGDILQFAGLSFMLIALFMQLNISVPAMNSIALFMQLIGFYLSNNYPVDTNIKYVLGLFYKTDGMCFPFFQWFIYPCFGILLATYLRHIVDKDVIYKALLIICGTLLTIYAASLQINGYNVQYIYSLAKDDFYNQDFLKTLFILLAIIVEISIVHFIFCQSEHAKLDNLAGFAGKHLNTIYIVQWLLVGWTSNIIDYYKDSRLDPTVSLPIGVLYIILSFLIVKGYLHIKKN